MTAHATRFVLYGVSSPIVVDVEESAQRAGVEIAAAVQNVEADAFVLDRTRLLTSRDLTPQLRDCPFLVPLFNPSNRLHASAEAFSLGFERAATLIDPTSVIASSSTLGRGVYVNAGSVIGGASTLSDFVLVNRGASVGHHVVLGRFVSVGPGAVICGQVTVGTGALVGAGAVVMPGLTIGDHAIVAAGAVVTRDVPAQSIAAGRRSRIVAQRSPAMPARSDR